MRKTISIPTMVGCWVLVAAQFVAAEDNKDVAAKSIEPAKVELGRPVDFDEDIFPILDSNCIACHNEAILEGKLNLEEVSFMLKGGKRGPAIVPKDPDKSLLYQVASRAKAPAMPPQPNKVEADSLTPEQLGLLRQWILEGAKGGSGSSSSSIEWQPLPTGLNAIYSVALSPWGQLAAGGRANRISIYDVESGNELAKLVDPNLAKLERDGKPMYGADAAHRDFVHSLAFSPDGTTLASGGYRIVKLWKRGQNVQKLQVAAPAEITALAVSANGHLLALAAVDNSISLINLADGKTVHTLSGHTAKITGLEFWPTLEEKAAFDKAAADASAAAVVAEKKAQDAAELAAADPKDEKLASAKTAADEALKSAQAAAQKAVGEKAAFDKKAAEQSKLVSASHDKTIRLWNPADGSQVATITSPAAINDVAFNLDATQAISADADNLLRVWNAVEPAEKPIREIPGHEKPASAVALVRPAGTQVISGSEDGSVRTWNLADGKPVLTLKHDGAVTSVAVRPDGQVAASTGANNIARLWQLSDGKQLAELKGDLGAVRQTVMLTEAQTVAKQKVELAEAARKAAEAGHKERVEAVKKADEAKAAADKAIPEAQAKEKAENEKLAAAKAELENAKDNEELKKKVAEAEKAAAAQTAAVKKAVDAQAAAVKGQERANKAVAAAKTKLDAMTAAKLATDEHQKGVDAQLAEATAAAKAAEKPIQAVSFSPDGKTVATSGDDGLVHLYSSSTGAARETFSGHTGQVAGLVYSTGSLLISGSVDKIAILWDTKPAWNLAGQIGTSQDDPLDTSASLFVNRVLALDFSDDGKMLATGGGDPSRSGELMIWDVAGLSLVREIKDAHSDSVMGVEFSRDGKYLLSGAADKFVKMFEVESGNHVRSFEGHTHHVLDVSWKADGASIASAGADNAIKVWNVETGEQRRTIGGYGKQVTAIQYIGVGDNIVSCGGDKTVRMHKTSDGKAVRSFGGGTDFMYSSAVSRDEAVVVAGGEDGVLRIWNGKDGKVVLAIAPPQ